MTNTIEIILVEDKNCRDTLFDVLSTSTEISLSKVSSKEDVVKLVNDDKPLVILIDINLLSGNNYPEWFGQLSKKDILIFAIKDANSDTKNIDKLLIAGVDDFIRKPLSVAEIINKIDIHMRLKFKKERISNLELKLENIEHLNEIQLRKMYDDMQLAYKELDLKKREIESLDRAKNDFIKIVSHEIRTPLNGILGFSEVIKTKLTPEYHGYINSLKESAQRIQEFSNKALLISQLKTSNFRKVDEPVSILYLINSLLEKDKNLLEKKHVFIRNNISNIILNTDFRLLERALTYILENTIRYAPEQSTIFLEELYANNKFTLIIIDEGPGFSEEVFNTLFGLFAHGDNYVDKNVGLGLYMVKLIMNYLGGGIKVSNQGEGGAIVKLIFPVEKLR